MRQPQLVEDPPDLRVMMRVEELERDQRRMADLTLGVLHLEDLRVLLVVEEVVDRAHRELVMQVVAHRGDLRVLVVEAGLLGEPPDLRLVECGLVEKLPDPRLLECGLIEKLPDPRVIKRGLVEKLPEARPRGRADREVSRKARA